MIPAMGTEQREADERPKPRQYTNEAGHIVIEFPFVRDDGWAKVTVGWSDEDSAWVAECSQEPGCIAVSEISQLDALADLVGALSGLCHIYQQRETELHRAIHNSPDSLAKELREAERDLRAVQQTICNNIDDHTTEMLQPLWRAERAIEAFAARIATPSSPTEGTTNG